MVSGPPIVAVEGEVGKTVMDVAMDHDIELEAASVPAASATSFGRRSTASSQVRRRARVLDVPRDFG